MYTGKSSYGDVAESLVSSKQRCEQLLQNHNSSMHVYSLETARTSNEKGRRIFKNASRAHTNGRIYSADHISIIEIDLVWKFQHIQQLILDKTMVL